MGLVRGGGGLVVLLLRLYGMLMIVLMILCWWVCSLSVCCPSADLWFACRALLFIYLCWLCLPLTVAALRLVRVLSEHSGIVFWISPRCAFFGVSLYLSFVLRLHTPEEISSVQFMCWPCRPLPANIYCGLKLTAFFLFSEGCAGLRQVSIDRAVLLG
jgi:hypothetical protein